MPPRAAWKIRADHSPLLPLGILSQRGAVPRRESEGGTPMESDGGLKVIRDWRCATKLVAVIVIALVAAYVVNATLQ